MGSPLTYDVRTPRKGHARQRRRRLRHRVHIAILTLRLGGTVTVDGEPLRRQTA
jgi:hypothetical protein